MNDSNKIKSPRICAKNLKLLYEGPINSKIISTRARKLLVKIQKFQPGFIEEIAKLSILGCKEFAHWFRNNFTLGSADFLEVLY